MTDSILQVMPADFPHDGASAQYDYSVGDCSTSERMCDDKSVLPPAARCSSSNCRKRSFVTGSRPLGRLIHDHKFRIVLEGLHDRDLLAHAPGVVPDLFSGTAARRAAQGAGRSGTHSWRVRTLAAARLIVRYRGMGFLQPAMHAVAPDAGRLPRLISFAVEHLPGADALARGFDFLVSDPPHHYMETGVLKGHQGASRGAATGCPQGLNRASIARIPSEPSEGRSSPPIDDL
jgi:hypothetical protein